MSIIPCLTPEANAYLQQRSVLQANMSNKIVAGVPAHLIQRLVDALMKCDELDDNPFEHFSMPQDNDQYDLAFDAMVAAVRAVYAHLPRREDVQ